MVPPRRGVASGRCGLNVTPDFTISVTIVCKSVPGQPKLRLQRSQHERSTNTVVMEQQVDMGVRVGRVRW